MILRPALLYFSALSLLTAATWAAAPEDAPADFAYFGNGMKIGEVSSDSALIWTRLTEKPDRFIDGAPAPKKLSPEQRKNSGALIRKMEGSVPGRAGQVRLRYWPTEPPTGSEGPQNPTQTEWLPVNGEDDYTAHFTLNELQAGTSYTVVLDAAGDSQGTQIRSIKGSFRTAPPASDNAGVRFGVVTCGDYPRRDHPDGHLIYPEMGRQNLDFFVHTGDIIYYDKPYPIADNIPLARFKWNRFYALPMQREFHRQTPSYFLKDDHDTLDDDCWPGQTYGDLTFAQGLQLFKEQNPHAERPFRTYRWGQHLQVWLMEGRDFRSPNRMPDGPEKTIWGPEQKEWLFKTVEESNATFRVIISPTPIVGPDRKKKKDNHANSNFSFEGNQIRSFVSKQANTFIVCGDRHWQYASKDAETGVREFACGPSSDSHAHGFKLEDRTDEHEYLQIIGGFLTVQVQPESEAGKDEKAQISFRHHAVDGSVQNEMSFPAN